MLERMRNTNGAVCKKLDKKDTGKNMVIIPTTDLPEWVRKLRSIGGGAREGGDGHQ